MVKHKVSHKMSACYLPFVLYALYRHIYTNSLSFAHSRIFVLLIKIIRYFQTLFDEYSFELAQFCSNINIYINKLYKCNIRIYIFYH